MTNLLMCMKNISKSTDLRVHYIIFYNINFYYFAQNRLLKKIDLSLILNSTHLK